MWGLRCVCVCGVCTVCILWCIYSIVCVVLVQCVWCVCIVCVYKLCVYLQRHTVGRFPVTLSTGLVLGNGTGMEGRGGHSHCAHFSVLWVPISNSCANVMISESCLSFHARPLERKWCNFYLNSNTSDLFLVNLIWRQHLILQSLPPAPPPNPGPMAEAFPIKGVIVRDIHFIKFCM